MAINKVIYDGETLMDVTDSTVTEENLLSGAVAYNAAGERIVGAVVTVPVDATPTEGSGNAVSSGGVFEALKSAGGGGSATRHTVTLTTGGWVSGDGYAWQQTVAVSGATITTDTDFDVDVDQSGTDANADALILEAFGLVTFADSVSGGIKFACPVEKPEVNIPLNIRIYA